MDNSDNLDPDILFSTDDEKTFQYQDQLPSLPVPDLQHTLDRYLDSVKPHLSPEEYKQTEFIVQQFAANEGKFLHEKLLEQASKSRNWLQKWWEQYAYMDFRLPIGPLLNFAGPGPYMHHYYPPREGSQLERTALILHMSFKYWMIIKRERLRPDKDSKGRQLCMNQFHRAYSTCRIPGVKRDHLKFYFKTESEGETPSHVVVLCRGRIFSVGVLGPDGEVLTPPEIHNQLQHIKNTCDKEPPGPAIGALTGDNRTSWAELRNRLIALHPQNYANLETIQKSLFAVVLEDESPTSESDLFHQLLAGNSTNRWFDKSFTLIFYRNGLVGSNCDHSPIDAMVLVVSTYYCDLSVMKCKGKWQGTQEIRDLSPPQELVFILDDVITKGIENAKQTNRAYASNLQQLALHFPGYGKTFLRKLKLHPDTHVQLSFQYAYYKTYQRPAPTYQTATTRKYYNARTETLRSCTMEALEWSKCMLDPNASVQTKVEMYKRAADKHNRLMAEATDNRGCDRHLLGMQIIAMESGLPMPKIYTDPAYQKSGGGGNFVLSTSFVGYTTVYGGVVPMVEHGYGCFYRIEPKQISTFISSWKSCPETDATRFAHTIHECLTEMGDMLEIGSSQSASQ